MPYIPIYSSSRAIVIFYSGCNRQPNINMRMHAISVYIVYIRRPQRLRASPKSVRFYTGTNTAPSKITHRTVALRVCRTTGGRMADIGRIGRSDERTRVANLERRSGQLAPCGINIIYTFIQWPKSVGTIYSKTLYMCAFARLAMHETRALQSNHILIYHAATVRGVYEFVL